MLHNADLMDVADDDPDPSEELEKPQVVENSPEAKDKKDDQFPSTEPVREFKPIEKQYFVPHFLSTKIGSGKMKNLSNRL